MGYAPARLFGNRDRRHFHLIWVGRYWEGTVSETHQKSIGYRLTNFAEEPNYGVDLSTI